MTGTNLRVIRGWIPMVWLCVLVSGCRPESPEAPGSPTAQATDDGSRPDVPDPDTAGAEPLVVAKIKQSRQQVIDQPDSAAAWGRLGMVFDVHNFVEAGLVCYQQAEALDREDFRWPYMSAVCMPDASPEQRVEVLKRAHALRPRYAPAAIRLANELVQMGEWEAAQPLFAKALREPSVASHALLGLARIDFNQQRFAQARERLEAALSKNPEHAEVFALLAPTYRALGESELAATAAKKASERRRKTPLLDPARTEVMFEGTTAAQLARQGNRLRARGEFAAAIQKLRLSIEADPTNPMAHFDLGLALASLGEWEAGIEALKQALEVDPEFEPAKQALAAVIGERDRQQQRSPAP